MKRAGRTLGILVLLALAALALAWLGTRLGAALWLHVEEAPPEAASVEPTPRAEAASPSVPPGAPQPHAPTPAEPVVIRDEDFVRSGTEKAERTPRSQRGRRRSEATRPGPEGVTDTEHNTVAGPRVVPRTLVEEVLADPSQLRGARALLHEENGEVVGYRLGGIANGHVLGRIGLRNGDVLVSVNGYDVTSADQALEAFQRLQSSTRFAVHLRRGGSPAVLHYVVR